MMNRMTAMATATASNRCRNILLFSIAVIAFAFGSSIYLCFCPTDLLLYDWFNINTQTDWIQDLRAHFEKVSTPDWFRHNLPDALWLMSFLLIMELIWSDSDSLYKSIFIHGMVATSILAELLQYFHVIPGTGDWWDVFVYLVTLLTFYLIKSI